MPGERTGARGNDLIDGTEVKSCSRIDQLDKCRDCLEPVSRFESNCPQCNSTNITRNNDSKWLFSIRTEAELHTITHGVKRVVLLLGDYPNYLIQDFNTLRFQAFEIWPESNRNSRFAEIMTNYYNLIYQEHRRRNASSNPAPKNFWPYQYQFYLCNPILTFSATVTNANVAPEIVIDHYVEPNADRSNIDSVIMPVEIINDREVKLILENAQDEEIKEMLKPEFVNTDISSLRRETTVNVKAKLSGINEKLRKYLTLRDTDRISSSSSVYARRQRVSE
jgi:hypothetical protein